MRGKGSLNLIKRLEHLEKLLEVNEYHVYYDSETIPERPDSIIIRLKWMDISDNMLYKNEQKL